ncbi:hypothetical protein [Spiroplasma endosymbiont of Polydrusus cervinus]|uniref:hypothetical protein n=1 Tax=Spiroplasma endosymbiont of Polydrusus cervinus TaxID=3066287 RepID=UPI0030CD07DA
MAKKQVDQQLEQFAEKTMAFWQHYKIETYNDKIVFNMNQTDFDKLLGEVNSFKPNSSVNSRISLIFKMIFNFFKNPTGTISAFKTKFYQTTAIDAKGIVPKFKMEIITDDKTITIKLFRNHYTNGWISRLLY